MSDLYIQLATTRHDDESRQSYPSAAEDFGWMVHCRNPDRPARTIIPIAFASMRDAELAKQGLERAGLDTFEAMKQKIHIEHDFATVRRVMLESLAW